MVIEIIDISVSNSGEKFKGKMHNVSAKLIIKDDLENVILEQSFPEKHKDIHNIKDTMEKICAKMGIAKKKIESELALKMKAEMEILSMISKLEVK